MNIFDKLLTNDSVNLKRAVSREPLFLNMEGIEALDDLLENEPPAINGSYDTFPISILNDQVNLIYAATNVGKTTFTKQIAVKYAEQGKRVVILSTETSNKDNWRNFKGVLQANPKIREHIHNIGIDMVGLLSMAELLEYVLKLSTTFDCIIIDYVDGDRLARNAVGKQPYQLAGDFIMDVRAELETSAPGVSCFMYSQVKTIEYYDNTKFQYKTPDQILVQNLGKLKGGSNPIMFSNSALLLYKDDQTGIRYVYTMKFKTEGRDDFNFVNKDGSLTNFKDYQGTHFRCDYNNGLYNFNKIAPRELKQHYGAGGIE